jgi:hypothetical protein
MMCRQNTNNDSENHPKNKWYDIKPTARGKAISYIVLYLLFIIVDSHDIFPWRHDVAIFAGAAATIALLYAEAFAVGAMTSVAWIALSLVVCFVALGLNLYVGPNLPDETEIRGWLLPANLPAVPTNCSFPVGGMLFVAGRNANWASGDGGTSLILALNDTPMITVEKDGDKLAFDVDLFDQTGNLAVRIIRNEFHLIQGEYSYKDRSDDRSVIVVYDRHSDELLHVQYANPSTVFITGTFYSRDGIKAIITQDNITVYGHPTFVVSHNCFQGGFYFRQTPDGAIIIR